MSTQYIQAREARANFSKILNSVRNDKDSYTIKIRNKPMAVLINIDIADRYLPAKSQKQKEVPSGKVFSKKALMWLEEMYGKNYTTKPKENISGNIDKILYGI